MDRDVTVYDNDRRFIVNNWTSEPFTVVWSGKPTTVEAGKSKDLPMYLAYHFTKHLVDREMQRDGKDAMMAVPELRKPYEDKTIAEITGDVDSPALAAIKESIKQQMESGSVNVEEGASVSAPAEGEFPTVNK